MSESEVRVSIAGYRDLTRVGSGGFSMVYRAHQEAFDRSVAVKVLTVELVDETAQRRFQRECRASGRLSNHPNIVTVLDSGFTDDGRPFITTEFMSNGSLADRLEEDGPYPLHEVLDIGVKMSAALAAVHAAGILHRDIKPPNILVSDYGEPALADFGISAITVGPDASIGTSSITPLHVAPEVLEGQPTSPQSDVYALGSTLYTLLAGRAPFQSLTDDALLPLMRRVVMDPVPPIDRDDVPDVVVDLLRYSMEKQPFARYPTAVAFGEAIQALQAHLGLAVTPLRKPGRTTADAAGTGDGNRVATTSDAVGAASTSEPVPGATSGPTRATPPLPGTTGPDPAAAAKSRTPLVLAAVGVVAVIAIVGAVLLTRSSSSDTAGSGNVISLGGGTKTGGGGDPATTAGSTDSSTDSSVAAGGTTSGVSGTGLRFDVDSGGLDSATPSSGGTLKVGVDAEPASWNPATSRFYGGSRMVADTIFEPLTTMTNDGAQPYLAGNVTPNDTFDQWTIDVRSGVSFSDGSDFNAAAIKANFDARLANDLMAPLLAPVQDVEIDGANVVVKLRIPWPAFPVALSGQSGLMASPETLKSSGTDKPIGTGPYTFDSWTQGQKVVVRKNPAYRISGRPYLDGIAFSIIPDPEKRRVALRTGDLDLIGTTDPVSIDDLAADHGVIGARTGDASAVIVNMKDPAFGEVRVRQALSAAVDRDAVVKQVFNDKTTSAGSAFPATSPLVQNGPSQAFDLDHAKQLVDDIKQSGATIPKLTLLVGSSAKQQQLADLLVADWAMAGIEVTKDAPSDDDTLTPIVDGKYQLALWTYDVPTDPDELFVWFHTDATPKEFTYNLPRFSNADNDKGFQDGRQASAPDARAGAYAAAAQAMVNESPAIWLAYLPSALVATPRIVGWNVDTVGGFGRGGTPWATDIGFK